MRCDVCNKETAELLDFSGMGFEFICPLKICKGCMDEYKGAQKRDAVKQFKQYIEGGD